MGERGPKPIPTETLKRRGSWRGDKNKSEPKPPSGRPKMPSWIGSDSYARLAWRQLMPILDNMGVITKADSIAFTRYCKLYSRWRQCEEYIEKEGMTFERKNYNGEVTGYCKRPEIDISKECSVEMGKIEAQFGLTPSARSRITLDDGDGVIDPILQLLSRPKKTS